jgi:hypothetical protein
MDFVDGLARVHSGIQFGCSFDPAHIQEMGQNAVEAFNHLIVNNPAGLMGVDLNNKSTGDQSTHGNVFKGEVNQTAIMSIYGRAHRRGQVKMPTVTFEGSPRDRDFYTSDEGMKGFKEVKDAFEQPKEA